MLLLIVVVRSEEETGFFPRLFKRQVYVLKPGWFNWVCSALLSTWMCVSGGEVLVRPLGCSPFLQCLWESSPDRTASLSPNH